MAVAVSTILSEALAHYDAGRHVIPCIGKVPVGGNWGHAWRDRDKLIAYFTANPDANLGLALDAQLIDIESDSPDQEQVFQELFDGVEVPFTPSFNSTRGKHFFFNADPRLAALELGVVNIQWLGVRIGAGGKAVHTLIPPSFNADGTQRVWEVSFDDCEPAELPTVVVDRILAALKKPTVQRTVTPPVGSVNPAVTAMLGMNIQDNSDGSKRLFGYACRAVEYDLSDADAIAAIHKAAESKPFLHDWSDSEITKRLRDAERATIRGLTASDTSLWVAEGRTDAANARRLAGRFGGSIRWCDPWRKWLVWDGCRWAIDEKCTVETYAKMIAKNLWVEVANHASE